MNDLVGSAYRSNDAKEFREGWIAGRFAAYRNVDAVRLLEEQHVTPTPDFEVRSEHTTWRYETTEAFVPEVMRDSGMDIAVTSLGRICEVAQAASRKKAGKEYKACHGLVMYISSPAFAFQPELRWPALQEALLPAADNFEEVWVLRESFALVWQNGAPVTGDIHTEF